MYKKLLNFIALLTSLFGYLQWGKDNSMFLFQVEYEVLSKLITNPIAALHPLTVLPILGQLLLCITLFQKSPSKIFTMIGIATLGILEGLLFFIGLTNLNFKILFSTLPYLITMVFIIKYLKQKRIFKQVDQ